MALYDPQQHRSYTLLYGQDPGATALLHAAWALVSWLPRPGPPAKPAGGYVSPGAVAHPFGLAWALDDAAKIYQFRREAQRTHEPGRGADDPLDRAEICVLGGVSLACCRAGHWPSKGREQRGWRRYARGLAAWQAMEALYQSHAHTLLAEIYGNVGQTEAGLTVLAEVLADVHNTGLCYCEAGCIGSRECCSPGCGRGGEAEACFRGALDVASRSRPNLGAARGYEPGTAMAAAGQAGRGPRTPGANLRLVHRGF